MARSVQEILAPEVIIEIVSRIALPGTTLSQIFGWQVGAGPTRGLTTPLDDQPGNEPQGNFRDWPGRSGEYDIFDHTRRIAGARVPGTASSRIAPQKVGKVQFTLPRPAEIVELSDEDIHNRRPIGGPTSQLDRGGVRYIEAQTRYIAERFANLIEFQTAAMIRGTYTFDQVGDELRHRFTGGETEISYQIPSGNKDRLDMLGGGAILSASWATAGTDIPANLFDINAAFVELTGQGLAHMVVTSKQWNNIVNNTKVHTQGGSANIVFESITRRSAGEFSAVLRSIPWLTIHVVDYGLEVWDGSSETFTKLIGDNYAAFFPEPDSSWCEYIRGGEYVTEGPNGVRDFRSGYYPYAWPLHDPSGWALANVFNGMPSLPVPKAMAYGEVEF